MTEVVGFLRALLRGFGQDPQTGLILYPPIVTMLRLRFLRIAIFLMSLLAILSRWPVAKAIAVIPEYLPTWFEDPPPVETANRDQPIRIDVVHSEG